MGAVSLQHILQNKYYGEVKIYANELLKSMEKLFQNYMMKTVWWNKGQLKLH